MSIHDLTQLVSPPAEPREVGSIEEWAAVEGQLGLILPSDYRDFIFTYGTGLFARFYCVANLFSADYLPWVRMICGYERDFRRDFPQWHPYAVYPERPGVFPWGNDENGNYYFWLTDGPPENWPVLSNAVRGEGYRRHDRTMTEYLAGVLRGEIRPLASGYPTLEDRVFHG